MERYPSYPFRVDFNYFGVLVREYLSLGDPTPRIRINELPPMVPLDELFPHGEVFVLHGNHPQLTLDISMPVDSLPLLLGVDVLEPTDD